MTKAEEYSLKFVIQKVEGFRLMPYVSTEIIGGYNVNSEIAEFLNECGVRRINSLLKEIDSLDPAEELHDFIIQGSYEQEAFISSPPFEVCFNTGGEDVLVAVEDFREILIEWRSFLENINEEHNMQGL